MTTPWENEQYAKAEEAEAQRRRERQDREPYVEAHTIPHGHRFWSDLGGVYVRASAAFDHKDEYVYGISGNSISRFDRHSRVKRYVT